MPGPAESKQPGSWTFRVQRRGAVSGEHLGVMGWGKSRKHLAACQNAEGTLEWVLKLIPEFTMEDRARRAF